MGAPSADTLFEQSRHLSRPERCRLLHLLQDDLLGEDAGDGWSWPDTLTRHAVIFNCTRATLSKRIKDGTVKAQPFGKLWQIALADFPGRRER